VREYRPFDKTIDQGCGITLRISTIPEESWSWDDLGDCMGSIRECRHHRRADAEEGEEWFAGSTQSDSYFWKPDPDNDTDGARDYVRKILSGEIQLCTVLVEVSFAGSVRGRDTLGLCSIGSYGSSEADVMDAVNGHGMIKEAFADAQAQVPKILAELTATRRDVRLARGILATLVG
jgi:hypothetical protein